MQRLFLAVIVSGLLLLVTARHMDANPESRMNDDPPSQERAGAPNTAPK